MQSFVEEIIARFAQSQVEYVIVGGVSAVLQGADLLTQDLDVCYRRTPDNLARLAAALAPLRPRLRGVPPDLPFTLDERALRMGLNFTLAIGNEALDLLGEMSGIGGYDQVIGQTDEMIVAGSRVYVLPLSLLIATKTAASRARDLAALPVLKAALERQQKQDSAPNEPPAHD